jgi:hypothetical protein
MSLAERRAPRLRALRPRGSIAAWQAAVGALLVAALGLRLWGFQHGLPFVFNADENAHFVPRAIGMFGHSYNPNYFVNPPAFTYLVHLAFAWRWGGREEVGAAFAADPTDAFAIGRALAALLGTLAVGFLVWTGARLLGRGPALVAGALLAVAFLPVHYSHLALNDVPTLAGACLSLAGSAGVLRRGRRRDFALAGAGLGLACATKYTGGIVLLSLLAAAAFSPAPLPRRLFGVALAAGAALALFLVANPYSVLDAETFLRGLSKQSEAAGDEAGKLGQTYSNGYGYYLWTLTWGLGWLPLLFAAGGAVWLALRDWRLALVLIGPVVVFWLFMGGQARFFARWLLPVYPLLCLLAAAGAAAAAAGLVRLLRRPRLAPVALAGLAALLLAQGLVLSIHNDLVLARTDTRELARAWMVRKVPEGAKVVVEPVFPDQWAMDPGRPSRVTGNGNRWRKWPTSRSRVNNDGTIRRGEGRLVKLEDYERTTRPQLVGSYERGGFCWVVTGSTQYGRAFAEPAEVPNALRYYEELERRGDVVYRIRPWGPGDSVSFSFDFSFNYAPLAYERPGPEIVVHRLHDCPR